MYNVACIFIDHVQSIVVLHTPCVKGSIVDKASSLVSIHGNIDHLNKANVYLLSIIRKIRISCQLSWG